MKHVFRPSYLFCDIEIGGFFRRSEEPGKLYVLLTRDAVKITAKRWTWWDDLKHDVRDVFCAQKGMWGGSK